MVCLITIKNLKRCPACILYEYKSHTKCMDIPLFTPLFTPGPVSDPLASLAYGPRCSFGFGRGGPGL